MENIFSTKGGLFFAVSSREYGNQDKGVSPKGAQDQLSFMTAYNIFNQPTDFQAIEMIYPTEILAVDDILIYLCGASYQDTFIDENICVNYNQVFELNRGQKLEFKGSKKGFRTIVFAVKKQSQTIKSIGKQRSSELEGYINQNYRHSFIRVIKGPEFDILKDSIFFENTWTISTNSSQMGLPLDGVSLDTQKIEMISQPVTDGTVQLAPSGPIVLLRHRQTVGGYPRIANVIEADINKLSQYIPGSKIRFKLVSLEEAYEENFILKKLLNQNIS
ncbi:hydrolase [Francisella philomiragia]|uniref:Allophanate hydrolase subunit 2 family protein n=1 Tax=Francisella philomiragia TaxID=28110 RepID=A0A0B6CRS2_9GAMM|nr:hydrolase [Francisella philomiragia]AJI53179.1 allophanate hydrolase subunit 2 family protein [Francisella philomiragia]